MNVQRYSLIGNDECPVMVGDATGSYVLFTDHEAALSHAYDLGWQAGYTQGKDDHREAGKRC